VRGGPPTKALASETGRRLPRCPKDILVLQLDISNCQNKQCVPLHGFAALRHALSKVTGDGFQDIATIRSLQQGLNGGLSRKTREAPPTTPMCERDISASRKDTGKARWAARTLPCLRTMSYSNFPANRRSDCSFTPRIAMNEATRNEVDCLS
jgi:hypothetical protein